MYLLGFTTLLVFCFSTEYRLLFCLSVCLSLAMFRKKKLFANKIEGTAADAVFFANFCREKYVLTYA
jgi:hypothetical protein